MPEVLPDLVLFAMERAPKRLDPYEHGRRPGPSAIEPQHPA
jgi:hypothetical protein